MFHLKFLLFVGFCCAVFGEDGNQAGRNQPPNKGSDCIRRITTQVARYFWKLQSRRIDYRERNNRVFADIPFLHLTTVYGWTMRGKQGRISQAREDGRGIITEYMIQYLNSDGNWTYINNSKTGKQIFANLGNIAVPDTITSVTLANPVTTLVLRVIPELWDGVPYMMMSIQHCADTDIAEKNPILPLQLAHNSVKKNLEDQVKKKIQNKISRLQQKVKLMKQKMAHQHQHHNNKVQTIHRGGKAGKHKSENHRTNHKKQFSKSKHRKPKKVNNKQTKQNGNHKAGDKHSKSNVKQTKERRNTRQGTLVDYHGYGLAIDDFDGRLKREQGKDAKSKDTDKHKTQNKNQRRKGKKTKGNNKNSKQTKKLERKHRKNDKQHGKSNKKKSHKKVAPKQPKKQKPKGKHKEGKSHPKKSKKIDRLSKKIDRTVKKLNQLKKEIHDIDKKPPKKGSKKVKVNKPQTPTPEVTKNNTVKTEAESVAPAKNQPSQKSEAMKQIEKQDNVVTKTAYESCRLMPVWRYGSTNFRPDDTFSALADNRQAWRAMYGLGIQPYRFRIPERYQKSRNQKYYLEIDFKKITNVFGLKVAGSSSQAQWGIITRFFLYHKRKESDPWQGYVDHLNQHRVFEIGSREKGNAHAPSVFKLDVPVTAKAIRMYPERWVSAPLMVVDLLTCETSYKH